MSAFDSVNNTDPQDVQEVHAGFTPLTDTAQRRALRYGAPLAVVDPLLSFLFDLHRLQESVITELERMGVSRCQLPPPFGDAKGASEGSSSIIGAATAKVQHHDTNMDHLAHYAALSTNSTQNTLSLHETRAHTVDAVLRWLAQTDKTSRTTTAATEEEKSTAAGRHLLTALVVNSQEGGTDKPCIVIEGDEDVDVMQPAAKRPRHEPTVRRCRDGGGVQGSAARVGPAPCGEHAMELVGCFAEAEMRRFVRQWTMYDDTLRCTLRKVRHLLHAVCASSIAGSLSSHAKWVEVDAAEVLTTSRLVVPACEVVERNFDRLIELNDDLATCQVAVHEAFVALETVVERYCTEAEVVARREAEYWDQVRVLECEFHALTQLRASIRCITRDVRRMCRADATDTITIGRDVDKVEKEGVERTEGANNDG